MLQEANTYLNDPGIVDYQTRYRNLPGQIGSWLESGWNALNSTEGRDRLEWLNRKVFPDYKPPPDRERGKNR